MKISYVVLSTLLAGITFVACGSDEKAGGAGGSSGTTPPGGDAGEAEGAGPQTFPPGATGESIVFVSRPVLDEGSVYWDVPKGMPGVGAFSRFRSAAPGKLMVREPDGKLRTLVDGSSPTAASANIIDVDAPDVDWDGQRIVFGGLVKDQFNKNGVGTTADANGWRIFVINVDGSGLQQLTTSDTDVDLTQFGDSGKAGYDDNDPCWLPDGRIVLSSSRWFAYGQYSGVRATNLFVMNADGRNLHRITAERNGADRPMVDPVTGKIVYARWWRNHRFPIDDLATIPDTQGFKQKDGLTADRDNPVGGPSMFRNAWQAATINPDGTGLAMWTGSFRDEAGNHVYGGAFLPNGDLLANFFPMYNMTEAGGFGGIRRYGRGPGGYKPVVGITRLTLDYVHADGPTSFGIYKGAYATDPAPLADGRVAFSYALDVAQDYGLYVMNADGTDIRLLYDNPKTAELRAKVIAKRAKPPVIADAITNVASVLPPTSDPSTFRKDGVFTFTALNVYANGPVDSEIVSAIPVGSGGKIRFFIDHQRTSPGSFPNLDWPIPLGELPISAAGFVEDTNAPANVQLFEQIRTPANKVPTTGGRYDVDGAAHVAGMNFGRPGAKARCVGCHAGHTMIAVPANDADAAFSNLAPGADIVVSSTRDAKSNPGLTDRRVMKGERYQYWQSAPNQTTGQWAKLIFPVSVTVRTVVLYNPREDAGASTLKVGSATVHLYSDAAGTIEVGSTTASNLTVAGTKVAFADIKARVVRVDLAGVTGAIDGVTVASLAEIEVIARGE